MPSVEWVVEHMHAHSAYGYSARFRFSALSSHRYPDYYRKSCRIGERFFWNKTTLYWSCIIACRLMAQVNGTNKISWKWLRQQVASNFVSFKRISSVLQMRCIRVSTLFVRPFFHPLHFLSLMFAIKLWPWQIFARFQSAYLYSPIVSPLIHCIV